MCDAVTRNCDSVTWNCDAVTRGREGYQMLIIN